MISPQRLALATLMFGSLTTVYAHTDAYLDTVVTPHGGQQRMVGSYHLELVTQPGRMELYVTDHVNQPIEVQGATGRAIVMVGGQKSTISLSYEHNNLLAGAGDYTMQQDLKVIAVVTIPQEKKPLQARFSPMEKPPQRSGDHSH